MISIYSLPLNLLPLRFWRKIRVLDNGCWEWTAGRQKPQGYGFFRWRGKGGYAHRLAYEALIGPIPEGLQSDHLCRYTACASPFHIEPVTPRENTLRSSSLAALNAKKTVCPKGHPYTYITPSGSRQCRVCIRLNSRAYYWRNLERARRRGREKYHASKPR